MVLLGCVQSAPGTRGSQGLSPGNEQELSSWPQLPHVHRGAHTNYGTRENLGTAQCDPVTAKLAQRGSAMDWKSHGRAVITQKSLIL